MSHPISPQRLLTQAKVLSGFGAGRGRPSPTDHRRGVSAAYYAWFHALIHEAVLEVFPRLGPAERVVATRWFQHSDLEKVSSWVVECAATAPGSAPSKRTNHKDGVWDLFSRPTPGAQRHQVVPPSLARIAQAFVDLYSARHLADYDHTARFPKATAQLYVKTAEDAVRQLQQHRTDVHVQTYLGLIAFRASRLVKPNG